MGLTFLGQKQSISLFQGNAVSGVFIIGRESGRVCRLGDFSTDNLLEGIYALAIGIQSIHEMHFESS